MDIQEEWDRFLIERWIVDKGSSMGIIIASFHLDHGIEGARYDNPLDLNKYPAVNLKHLDIFGFIARYFPKVSTWLLAHVKNHNINPETKEKIIQAFLKMKMPGKHQGVSQKNQAKSELGKDLKEYRRILKSNEISVSQMRSRYDWKTVK
jgi:hypothetical protein